MKAVIQAGGLGARMRPHTLVLPKPLLPVRGMPVIELLLKWLRRAGVEQTYITIGYLGHLLQAVCGDGSQWDLSIEYSEEKEPMGTVGPLQLLGPGKLDQPFVMLNGDLITDLNLRQLMKYHHSHDALVTVAVTKKPVNVDLGVLECEESKVLSFKEKPVLDYTVSMGVYCMDPKVLEVIPKGVPFGFDDLMYHMLDNNLEVRVFEHHGLWMDIGRPDDFAKAQEVIEQNQSLLHGL